MTRRFGEIVTLFTSFGVMTRLFRPRKLQFIEGERPKGASSATAAVHAGPACDMRMPSVQTREREGEDDMAHDLIEKNPALKDPILAVLESMVRVLQGADAQGRASTTEPIGNEAAGRGNSARVSTGAPVSAGTGADAGRTGTRVDRSAVENAAQLAWKSTYRLTPALTVDTLVRNDALTLTTLVDGEPYDGTLEDVQLDLSVPDDAQAVCDLALTPYGREILQEYRPETLLAHLLAGKARYQPIFDAVLQSCAEAPSRSRADLEAVVNGFGSLTHAKPNDEQQTVYPQFFLDTLEEAGGIAWRDGGWRITEAGRAFLSGRRPSR